MKNESNDRKMERYRGICGRAETGWVMVFVLAQGVDMFWGFIESGRQRTKRPRKKVSPSKTGFWIFLVMEEGIKGETYQEHKEEI